MPSVKEVCTERFGSVHALASGRTYNWHWLIEHHGYRTPIEARDHGRPLSNELALSRNSEYKRACTGRLVAIPAQATTLEVQLGVDSDAPAEELDELTTSLGGQLLELDVEAVERPRSQEPPPGARAVEAAALGELLVTLAPAVLGAVVETIRSSLSRSRGRSAKLRLGDTEIEITGASSEQQEQLVATFLARQAED